MSGEKDTRAPPASSGPAQRTYDSLLTVYGGVRDETPREGRAVVSIVPMDRRSWWQHVGGGGAGTRAALYQKVDPPTDGSDTQLERQEPKPVHVHVFVKKGK